jgi:multiple sugar transport system permease protein
MPPDFVAIQNYHTMIADEVFRVAVTNTVVFVFVTTAVQIVLGTALAVLAERSRIFSSVARNIILWPAILAPVSVSVIWWLILNIEFGLLNDMLNRLGLPTQTWLASSTWALPTVMVVDVWHWTPVVFLFALAGLANIDRSLYEAARVDGASEWNVFWHITLPLLLPTLAMAAVTRIILGFKVFDEIFVLTDGGPGVATEVISTYVREVFVDRLQFGYGAFLSLTVVTIVLVFLAAYLVVSSVLPKIVRTFR